MGTVLLRVVEGKALLQVRSGRGQLSHKEQGGSQRITGQEEVRGLALLGQVQQLLCQLTGRP